MWVCVKESMGVADLMALHCVSAVSERCSQREDGGRARGRHSAAGEEEEREGEEQTMRRLHR